MKNQKGGRGALGLDSISKRDADRLAWHVKQELRAARVAKLVSETDWEWGSKKSSKRKGRK